MKKLYHLSILAISLMIFSCRTANKLYENGHYDEAVELGAKKLQKDPNDAKTLDMLQNAYRFAVDEHEAKIRNLNASTSELKWESIYGEYLQLQKLHESVRRSPDAYKLLKPTDYSTFVTTYREKSGNARYERGISLLQLGDRQNAKRAYYEFQSALNYIPDDLAIKNKVDEAFNQAVLNIVILPIEERGSYQYSSYNQRYRGFDDNVLRYLKQNSGNQFVRYYSPIEARSRNVQPDHIVDIRFSSFNIGRTTDEMSNRVLTKEVVVKETVYKPDSIIKEYAKVNARIVTTTRTMRSEGMIQVAVRDANQQNGWTDQFRGQHFWTTEFAHYTGDIRALSESDKQIVNRPKQNPPREEDIIRIIMDEIQSKLECGIKDYFNRL